MKGAWGECVAREFLEKNGYQTVETNFRTRFGEIDIIASCAQYIVFVEVKTRKNNRFAAAFEHVTTAKQRRILIAAEQWLQKHPTPLQPRLDVIEVYGEQDGPPPQIHHIQNAFGGCV